MEIDNFYKIECLIRFDNLENSFYVVSIVKRRKDNPDMISSSARVDTFFIDFSREKGLDHYMERIKDSCIRNNARAYVLLDAVCYKKVAINLAKYCLEAIENGSFFGVKNAYASIACQIKSRHPLVKKRWVIDVDTLDIEKQSEITMQATHTYNMCQAILDTKNGLHLIVSPFDSRDFEKKYPEIEIKKHSPTLLYYKGVSK